MDGVNWIPHLQLPTNEGEDIQFPIELEPRTVRAGHQVLDRRILTETPRALKQTKML